MNVFSEKRKSANAVNACKKRVILYIYHTLT